MKGMSKREEGDDTELNKVHGATPRFGVVVSAVTLVVVIAGALGTWSIFKNQQDHFAWRLITSQKPGNSGIGWALEHLNGRGVKLNHVVLEPLAFFPQALAADTNPPASQRTAATSRLQAYAADRVLDGIVLRHAWLNRTNFSNSSLKEADLREATLEGADFTGSSLEQAKLDGAVMIRANLTSATLAHVRAPRVNLEGATAIHAGFQEADLASANLQKMIGIGAFFDNAGMTAVLLDGAVLGGASLASVDLTGAILNDTKLDYANLTDADLSQAFIGDTNFKGANISGMHLAGAKGLEDAQWKGAWAWVDNTDALTAATWLDGAVMDAWTKVLSDVIVYYSVTCREAWLERVASEIQSADVAVAIRLYRPPKQGDCVVTGHKIVSNEESLPDKVAYQAGSVDVGD